MHEEDMLDSTAGAEQGESKFGEADKEEPITKTIRIVGGTCALEDMVTDLRFSATGFDGECGFF